jgi:hypothetical protein
MFTVVFIAFRSVFSDIPRQTLRKSSPWSILTGFLLYCWGVLVIVHRVVHALSVEQLRRILSKINCQSLV